ncbi:hypothetical protein BCF46_1383 [Litoreibacter meonggei]|uniref:Uncharacterized protein n=1 Tax=Litoreibacter meonggei TaxID=1049199 RepID=A0A497X157_9RHOB|nr:hypothetical protein [Litoreibacter meonggei]RLJ59235.1 hypothetical protein BCF46_1383 [Litoreibacter meonggei]
MVTKTEAISALTNELSVSSYSGQAFENNIDTIEFGSFEYLSTPSDALAYATASGNGVLFDFGNDDTLLVQNVTKVQLTNDIDIM